MKKPTKEVYCPNCGSLCLQGMEEANQYMNPANKILAYYSLINGRDPLPSWDEIGYPKYDRNGNILMTHVIKCPNYGKKIKRIKYGLFFDSYEEVEDTNHLLEVANPLLPAKSKKN